MNNKNRTMSILSGIAIVLVVLGHLDFDILSFGGLFSYYSFHVLIFVFISGYFYKTDDEKNIVSFLGRKAKHLLLPYFIWNAVYAVISTIMANKGFIYCSKFSLFNFFAEPFLGGHQYGLNFASWFVPALFIIQVVYLFAHKLLDLLKIKNEWVLMAFLLICGIATVYLAQTGHVWGYLKTPGRILFMLPVFQMGRIYKEYLEKRDVVSDLIYFPALLGIQLLLVMISEGNINFSAVWCTSFSTFCFVPYCTIITGIAFWLRIAKILSRVDLGIMFEKIGDNSFHVMMHHVLVFFVINLISLAIFKTTNSANPFDMISFKENVNYVYLINNQYQWKYVFLAAGVGIPSLCAGLIKKIKRPLL